MGQAKNRGSFEERQRAAQAEREDHRAVDINLTRIEMPHFGRVTEMMMKVGSVGVSRRGADLMDQIKGWRQDDGTLLVAVDIPGLSDAVRVPPGQWELLTQEQYDAEAPEAERRMKADPELLRDAAKSMRKRADGIEAWRERSKEKIERATTLALVIDRSAVGLKAADDMRLRMPDSRSVLDQWEASENEFVLFCMLSESRFARGVPDILALMAVAIPEVCARAAEEGGHAAFTFAVSPDIAEDLHRLASELQPGKADGLSS